MHIPVGVGSVGHFMNHGARDVHPDMNPSVVSASTPATSSSRLLTGLCGVVGAILFVIIFWQLRTAGRRKKAARASSAARYSFMPFMYGAEEKPAFVSSKGVDYPHKIALLAASAPSDPFASSWKPQIKGVTLPSGVTVPPIAVTAPERSPIAQDEFPPPTPQSGPSVSPLPTPPPAYRILGLHTIPVPATPQESEPTYVPPPTPMHKSPGRTVSTLVRESFDLPPAPVPSPRSESFHPTADSTRPAPRAGLAPRSLPRLMVVATSFQPTRPDELGLRAGETLHLIKEFDDEWCLVQRIGRSNAKRGVVPRFCLSERPRAITNCGRISNSIFNGVRHK